MLRLIVLIITHLAVFACGICITLVTLRGRAKALEFRKHLLDTHEMFLDLRADQLVPAPLTGEAATMPGRHRRPQGARSIVALTAVQPAVATKPRPSLVTMGLADAVAQLATDRARRVQEHRQFVDLMAWAKRTAGVQVTRQRPRLSQAG